MTEDVLAAVERIVRDSRDSGVTVEDVLENLRKSYGIERSVSAVRGILRQLARDRRLVTDTRPTGKPGNREIVYYHIDVAERILALPPVETKEGIEETISAAIEPGIEPILRSLERMLAGDPVIGVVRDMAQEIAGLDPRELITDMAAWVADKAREIESRFLNAPDDRSRDAEYDRLCGLSEFVRRFFWQGLNIPPVFLEVDVYPLRRTGMGRVAGEDTVRFDRDGIRDLLDRYVFGERVAAIERVESAARTQSICSTDASLQKVPDRDRLPVRPAEYWQDRETHAIITSAAALQARLLRELQGIQALIDLDVDPRNPGRYDAVTAIREGRMLRAISSTFSVTTAGSASSGRQCRSGNTTTT